MAIVEMLLLLPNPDSIISNINISKMLVNSLLDPMKKPESGK